MRHVHHVIVQSWARVVRSAILLGDADAAYRITRTLVARCRELGLWT